MKTRDDLVLVIQRQHDAIDTLFAMLIEETRTARTHARAAPFMPSKSGEVWEAALAGAEVMRQAQLPGGKPDSHSLEDLRDALVRCGEQASAGLQHEHGDCPATFACSAIVAELCSLGMPPEGWQEVTLES